MAINQELWLTDLAANLYSEKDWYRVSKNWSSYVNGSIVHIPQAVASTTPVRITGATVYPVAPVKVTFADKTFTNAMVASAPQFVTNLDMAEASFDTRSSLMADMVGFLKQAIAIEILHSWKPVITATGSILRTTGSTTRTNIYGQAAMKSLTFADILKAKAKLVKSNASLTDIYIFVDPIMHNDLLAMDEFKGSDTLNAAIATEGYVGAVAGMKVIQLPMGIPYLNNAGAPAEVAAIDYSDAYANTHYSAALIVDATKVGYALGTKENGEIKIGVEAYATGYYSDVMQAHTRVGGASLYDADANDYIKGVVSIIEVA